MTSRKEGSLSLAWMSLAKAPVSSPPPTGVAASRGLNVQQTRRLPRYVPNSHDMNPSPPPPKKEKKEMRCFNLPCPRSGGGRDLGLGKLWETQPYGQARGRWPIAKETAPLGSVRPGAGLKLEFLGATG